MSFVKVLDGNESAAWGVKLSKPDVICAYPITPQSPLVELLAEFVANGELDAEYVEVESEHSALSVLHGAAMAGGRTFTATSSQGLFLMFEPYFRTSGLRLPIVMCIVGREAYSPATVWGGQQDSILVRDCGWIHIYPENNQEILDTVIQAYKIAEDDNILLPISICYEGFFMSHLAEKVELPDSYEVDKFIPHRVKSLIDPENPAAIDPLLPGPLLTRQRFEHIMALERAKKIIKDVDTEYGKIFGRNYGGLVDPYLLEDAEITIVTMGGMSGTAKVGIDLARKEGLKVGLLRIRVHRPFPKEEIMKLFADKPIIGIVDRNVHFGFDVGVLSTEIKSALYDAECKPSTVSFIAGLGGCDVKVDDFLKIIKILDKVKRKEIKIERTIWLNLEE